MKTILLVQNDKIEQFEDLLRFDEFYNWKEESGDFRTLYIFENTTQEQNDLLESFEKEVNEQ